MGNEIEGGDGGLVVLFGRIRGEREAKAREVSRAIADVENMVRMRN